MARLTAVSGYGISDIKYYYEDTQQGTATGNGLGLFHGRDRKTL
jgi:hypothetical protein